MSTNQVWALSSETTWFLAPPKHMEEHLTACRCWQLNKTEHFLLLDVNKWLWWVNRKWIRRVVEVSPALAAGAAPAGAAGGGGVGGVAESRGGRWRVEVGEEWGEGTVGHHLNLRCLPDSPNISLNIYICITVYSFPACMLARTHARVCARTYTDKLVHTHTHAHSFHVYICYFFPCIIGPSKCFGWLCEGRTQARGSQWAYRKRGKILHAEENNNQYQRLLSKYNFFIQYIKKYIYIAFSLINCPLTSLTPCPRGVPQNKVLPPLTLSFLGLCYCQQM